MKPEVTLDLVHKAFEKSKFRWFAFIITDKVVFSSNFTALALEGVAAMAKDGVLAKILSEQFDVVTENGNSVARKRQLFGIGDCKVTDSTDFILDAVNILYSSRMQWVMIVVDSKHTFDVYSRVMDRTKSEILRFVNDGSFEINTLGAASLKRNQQ